MWRTLHSWLNKPATQRLGWAILVSMLLHMWLFSGHFLAFPAFKKDTQIIDARIVLKKQAVPAVTEPAPKQASPAESAKSPKPRQKPVRKPAPKPVPPEIKPVEAPKETPLEPAPVAENPAVTEPVQPPPLPAQPEVAAEAPPPMEDEGLAINQNAYPYVATDFNVSTKIDGHAEGKARIVYSLTDEKHYKITSLTEARGLAALFLKDLLQESEGELTKLGLQPHRYLYQYGNDHDKTYQAMFDWQNNTLLMTSASSEKSEHLFAGTQDLLSFMYQFMFVPPLDTMQIPITNGRKLRIYDYQFEGEVVLSGQLGEVNTLHISRGGRDPDERFELWLAPAYQNIPIKIRKTEKDGKVYEMTATRINTQRPTQNNN